ncbi:hypothetical protein ASG43_08620 [Aureimonas sp. Leaf454]|uniref:calcium-binding protein n=1 Tax=Aureimonas sp. Leaf454 TaxID=1736381 RepID=UPI0006F8489F|nr:hypothetical protein [Aureimonas sp. Leaf454]KQT48894.1 hypothetical protein ASG43_08620 [Aureimonas sp. Leaf454]
MAEIYTSAESANLSVLSPEAHDHINAILSDLGLSGIGDLAVSPTGTADVSSLQGETMPTAMPGNLDDPLFADGSVDESAVIVGETGPVVLTGLGDDTVFATDGGHAITGTIGHSLAYGGLGDDSIFAGSGGGDPALFAGGGSDTLIASMGMDTLWGSSGGQSLLIGGTQGQTEIDAGGVGGDTIPSAFGNDTLLGGGASIESSGDHATLYAAGDTIAAHGDHALVDHSSSGSDYQTDIFGAPSTIFGGAGDDTIQLHDTSAFASVSGGAGDDHFLSYGLTDSVSGGDGSDPFAMAGFGTGYDTLSGEAGDDSLFFQDHSFSDAHIATSGTSTLVSFDDGYTANYSGFEDLRFKDTVFSS